MAITKDVENGVGMQDAQGNEARQPLLIHQEESSGDSQGSIWMVLLSTAVVVCGSFEFGSCVSYSSSSSSSKSVNSS